MRHCRRCVALTLALLVGCSVNEGWDLPPPVVWEVDAVELCDAAPISEARLLDLLSWWSELDADYTTGEVFTSPCMTDVTDGHIRVDAANLGELLERHVGGFTTYDQERLIEETEPGRFNEVVVRYSATVHLNLVVGDDLAHHELGHAWGWEHPFDDRSGHLMSPHVGDAIDGLEVYGAE